jgi:hypothetical protein
MNFLRQHLLILCLITILGFGADLLLRKLAFPNASIDLSITRAEIQTRAERWAKEAGYFGRNPVKATIFSGDSWARTFLEYELGLSAANELMKETVPAWFWRTRMCEYREVRECVVDISPTGRLVGLRNEIEAETVLPRLSLAQAEEIARTLIQTRAKLSLADYVLVENASGTELEHTIHSFIWENSRTNYHGARLRISATVEGDRVSRFGHWLQLPADWMRDFEKLRSYNRMQGSLNTVVHWALIVGSFLGFAWALANGILRLRVAIAIGLIVGLCNLLESINSYPYYIFSFETNQPLLSYLIRQLIYANTSAIWIGIYCCATAGAGEFLYRLEWPRKIALENLFTKTGMRSQEFLLALAAGCALAAIQLTWTSLYYCVGRQFGIWSPLMLDQAQCLSSVFPFFSGVELGVYATFTEELLYRVIALSVIRRLTNNFWLANLFQALTWALGHSNYPQEPPYARVLELTVSGLMYGWVLRRYGLLATIAGHYLYDAFLMVQPLFHSTLLPEKISALIALAPVPLMLLWGLGLAKRFGLAAAPEALLNGSIKTLHSRVRELAPIAAEYVYKPLRKPLRLTLLSITIVSLGFSMFYSYRAVTDSVQVLITQNEAIGIARKYLQSHGHSMQGMTPVVDFQRYGSGPGFQYVLEKAGFEKTRELIGNADLVVGWQLRFFKPLSPDEYFVKLQPDGRVRGLILSLSPDAKGAVLNEAHARDIAFKLLRLEQPWLSPFKVTSAKLTQRLERTDYDLTVIVDKFSVGAAQYKAVVSVLGDKMSGPFVGWSIPDKWQHEFTRKSLREQVVFVMACCSEFVIGVALLFWLVSTLKGANLQWRIALLFAVVPVVLLLSIVALYSNQLFVNYLPSMPLTNYYTLVAVGVTVTVISTGAIAAGAILAALASFDSLKSDTSVHAIASFALKPVAAARSSLQREFWLDGVLSGYCAGFAVLAGWILIDSIYQSLSPTVNLFDILPLIYLIKSMQPALTAALFAILVGMTAMVAAAGFASIYRKFFEKTPILLFATIVLVSFFETAEHYWKDHVLEFMTSVIVCCALWWWMKACARANPIAYFVGGYTGILAIAMWSITRFAPLYTDVVYILLGLLACPLFYLYFIYLNDSAAENR